MISDRNPGGLRRNLTQSGKHTLAGDLLAARILASARKIMIERGASGFSVRKVAQDAGVSIGHLQHYFATKGDLLQAMVISLEEEFYQHFVENIAPIKDPVERFVACAEYVLDDGQRESLIALLREFWVMAARDEEIADSLNEFYRGCRRFAASILLEANRDLEYNEARRRGCAAVSMLSGAFLYLDPWRGGETFADFREHLLSYMRQMPFLDIETPLPGAA